MGTSSVCALLAWVSVCAALAGCVSSEQNKSQGEQDVREKKPPVPERDGCTLVGCGPAITLRASLSDAVAELPMLAIDVCLNDTCLSGTLPKVDAAGRWGGLFPQPVEGSPHATASMDRAPGSVRFWAEYYPRSIDDLHDGDRFSVTARDPAGDIVFSASRTIAYVESYPNGEGCSPLCRTVTLDVENSADSE